MSVRLAPANFRARPIEQIPMNRRRLMTMMTTRVRAGLAALLVVLGTAPVALHADDIDIYTPVVDADFEPTVMFMIDTSASMAFTGKAWYPTRMDRLRAPLVDYLRSATDVKVGLSAFNGLKRGGAILQPALSLDTDRCPDNRCESVTIRAHVAAEGDDAEERLTDNYVRLYSAAAYLGVKNNIFLSGAWYSDQWDGQTVMAPVAGGAPEPSEVLMLGADAQNRPMRVGIHYPTIDSRPNIKLKSTFVYFRWAGYEHLDPDAGEGQGVAKLRIALDSRPESPAFADAPGQRLDDRPLTDWIDWDVTRPADEGKATDSETLIRTPNLVKLFEQVRASGTRGPVTVIVELREPSSANAKNTVAMLGNHSRGSHLPPPRFYYGAERTNSRPSYRTGARFDGLRIPRGATITSAHMEVLPWRIPHTGDADWQVRFENAGDTVGFDNQPGDLSKRTLTDDFVRWRPEPWQGKNSTDGRKRSPDLAGLVQGIVDRTDWCSGNAMSVYVEGDGERGAFQYRAGVNKAPSFHVTFDPRTADPDDACTQKLGRDVQLYTSAADLASVNRRSPSYVPGEIFETPEWHSAYEMRFDDIDLDRGDDVARVKLLLQSAADPIVTAIRHYVRIWGSPPGEGGDDGRSPYLRANGAPETRWVDTNPIKNARIESADLSAAVQAVIDGPDWVRGSSLHVMFGTHRTNEKSVYTRSASNGGGPRLAITTRVRGAEASRVPIRTARDELIDSLQTLPTTGDTPLVDAFYESAAYLVGEAVEHGARRGEQAPENAVHRLSHPDSYTGGTVTRSFECDASNPSDPACVDEEIAGSPIYAAPESSECRPNQLVLVTDGDPSESSAGSAALIRSLTGQSICAAGPAAQACGVELARWLRQGGPDRHPVTVSTIGFDFFSEYLERLSDAGGGEAYSVNSSAALSEALRRIGDANLQPARSVTAPGIAVSATNRTVHSDTLVVPLFAPAYDTTRWAGNVKVYSLASTPNGVQVVDADGRPAIDPATGLPDQAARSWWSSMPDGAQVEHGGAASRLSASRRILTHPRRSRNANHARRTLVDFDPSIDSVSARRLGVSDDDRDDAIRWVRGEDVRDEDDDGNVTEPRRRMGAAIHTTSRVLSFAITSSGPTRTMTGTRSLVFVGTQDGLLSAIKTDTGNEAFAFLPRELWKDALSGFDGDSKTRTYGLDGPLSTWISGDDGDGIVEANEGERAFVIVGMRRGGTRYYTLEVTDPDDPVLLWTTDPSRVGYEQLGQTWSRPVHVRVFRADGTPRDALIFGNGYHTVNDRSKRRASDIGRDDGAIYVVDALDGHVIERIDHDDHPDLIWSIPSEIAVADIEGDGITDILIAGDLGGNVWRVDLEAPIGSNGRRGKTTFRTTLAARLGAREDADAGDRRRYDRRFFDAPDLSLVADEATGLRLGVSIGSGRRDDPTSSGVDDGLFHLRLDLGAARDVPIELADLEDATDDGATGVDEGWFIDFARPGEKMLGTPVTLGHQVFATTYVPPPHASTTCEPALGGGRLYGVRLSDGAPLMRNGSGSDVPSQSRELVTEGIPAPVSVLILEGESSPVGLVGLERVDEVGADMTRLQTYWIEQ